MYLSTISSTSRNKIDDSLRSRFADFDVNSIYVLRILTLNLFEMSRKTITEEK